MSDYYQLLGVPPQASARLIARAYRQRTVARHRTRVLQLQDQLQLMQEALDTLTDPVRRREYDAELERERAPARRAEDERLRSEGRARVAIARELGTTSRRIGQQASAENAAQVRAIAAEHDLIEARESRSRRRRELWRRASGPLALVILAAAAWLLLEPR